MSRPLDRGASAVDQPVARALDTVIVAAAATFAASVAAVVFTVLSADWAIHEVGHFAVPALMVAVVLVRIVQYARRRPSAPDAAWDAARAVSASDARLARLLAHAVPIAWLVGSGSILVRHGPHHVGAGLVIGAWLPLVAFLWIAATFAWHDACRDRIATGIEASERRFRDYWRDVAGPR
jgi:hypothetical protein